MNVRRERNDNRFFRKLSKGGIYFESSSRWCPRPRIKDFNTSEPLIRNQFDLIGARKLPAQNAGGLLRKQPLQNNGFVAADLSRVFGDEIGQVPSLYCNPEISLVLIGVEGCPPKIRAASTKTTPPEQWFCSGRSVPRFLGQIGQVPSLYCNPEISLILIRAESCPPKIRAASTKTTLCQNQWVCSGRSGPRFWGTDRAGSLSQAECVLPYLFMAIPASANRCIRRSGCRVATQDAYADESLRAALDESVRAADAGLATELTLGVLRWQRLLDFVIDRNLAKKTKTLDIEVRVALRMGMYQLFFLERVPAHAAVHESVELVKKARKRSAAPLVNAVLRKAAKESIRAGAPGENVDRLLSKDLPRAEYLGIRHSHPTWLVERWLGSFEEERTQALLEANNRVPGNSFLICSIRNVARRPQWHRWWKRAAGVTPGRLLRDAWTLGGVEIQAPVKRAMRRGWICNSRTKLPCRSASRLRCSRECRSRRFARLPGGKTLPVAVPLAAVRTDT